MDAVEVKTFLGEGSSAVAHGANNLSPK